MDQIYGASLILLKDNIPGIVYFLLVQKQIGFKRVSGLSAHFEPQSNYYEFLILSMELVIQVFTVSVLNAHEISLCSFLLRCVIE